MIKASLTTPSGPALFLGLSRGNVERLLEGQPISFPTEPFRLSGPFVQVVIHFGETEDAILDELRELGVPTIDGDGVG